MVEPVDLTDDERAAIAALGNLAGTNEGEFALRVSKLMRDIARQEIASLAGLALRRSQDRNYTRSPGLNAAIDIANEEAAQFWGEVLAEYGGHTMPEESSEK